MIIPPDEDLSHNNETGDFSVVIIQGLNDVPKPMELHNKTSDQATDMYESEDFDVTITNNPTCSQHKIKKQWPSCEKWKLCDLFPV